MFKIQKPPFLDRIQKYINCMTYYNNYQGNGRGRTCATQVFMYKDSTYDHEIFRNGCAKWCETCHLREWCCYGIGGAYIV